MNRNFTLAILLAALCCAPAHAVVTFDWAAIGNPGNANDDTGFGRVTYAYRISKHEVTNAQYTEFLNAVAATDALGLYNENMGSSTWGGIIRGGLSGSYTYSVKSPAVGQGPGGSDYAYDDTPVIYVSFLDGLRFVNWLHNGQGSGGTESGVYALDSVVYDRRSPGAKYWIPSENEWYKAAYFDYGTGAYYDYPTSTNSRPNNNLPSADTGNSANFLLAIENRAYPLTDVGAYALSKSPYDTYDQGGNVQEWTEGTFFESRVVRGGDWATLVFDLSARSGRKRASDSGDSAFVGFRVASSTPEPSALSMGALSTVGLLVCRRRKGNASAFPLCLKQSGIKQSLNTKVALLALVACAISSNDAAGAYTITGKTFASAKSPGGNGIFIESSRVTITGDSAPTTAYWGFDIPANADLFRGDSWEAYARFNGGSATVSQNIAYCCGALSGKWEHPIGMVDLYARLRTARPAELRITVSFGGTSGEPEKYDDDKDTIYVPPDCCGADKENDQVAGAYLTSASLAVPVFADHGLSDFVYSQAPAEPPPADPEPWKPAYFFASHDIPFSSFLIPDALPGGDDQFEVVIGEYESHILQAGVPFDFTQHVPGGVTAFVLTGFDADSDLVMGKSFPYTHAYKFAEAGATFVRHGPLTPGDFTLGGLVDGDDLALWTNGFGMNGELPADADNDSDVDGNDFLIWQRNLDPPQGIHSAPEPSSSLLAAIVVLAAASRSRSSSSRLSWAPPEGWSSYEFRHEAIGET